jgi:cephalosporin hydroxylase
LIIETGTANGGSSLYMASIMDLLNYNGEIITIDVNQVENRPEHKRINYLHGFSTSQEIVDQVKKYAEGKNKILVILDSDHSKKNVLEELRIYNKFVTKGSYLIVEDSNVNGHPTCPEFGPGPWEAIDAFLNENNEFEIDKDKEKFYFTFNPNGYLRKNK